MYGHGGHWGSDIVASHRELGDEESEDDHGMDGWIEISSSKRGQASVDVNIKSEGGQARTEIETQVAQEIIYEGRTRQLRGSILTWSHVTARVAASATGTLELYPIPRNDKIG